jgi:hypothetical protein
MTERGRNAAAFAIFFAVVALLLFAGWRLTGSEILIRDCSFDSADWADGREERKSLERYAALQPMAEDVEECDLVAGRSPADVRALLGAPDDTNKLRPGRPRRWTYSLGSAHSLDSTDHLLSIEFGSDDRVRLASEA